MCPHLGTREYCILSFIPPYLPTHQPGVSFYHVSLTWFSSSLSFPTNLAEINSYVQMSEIQNLIVPLRCCSCQLPRRKPGKEDQRQRHCGKKLSIRYYFAYSQERRKLVGNKKVGIICDEVFVGTFRSVYCIAMQSR